MSEDKYTRELSSRPFFRIMAWVGILIIIGLVIATIITGISGSEYFMGFLVLTMIVPVFIYVVLWIGRVIYNSVNDNTESTNVDELKDDSIE